MTVFSRFINPKFPTICSSRKEIHSLVDNPACRAVSDHADCYVLYGHHSALSHAHDHHYRSGKRFESNQRCHNRRFHLVSLGKNVNQQNRQDHDL